MARSWDFVTTRNQFLIVCFLASCSTSTGVGLNQPECFTSLVNNNRLSFCLSMEMESSNYQDLCLESGEIILVYGFLVHIPTSELACGEVSQLSLCYNSTMRSSCLKNTSSEYVNRLMWSIMEGFSGKTISEVNSLLVVDYLKNNSLLGLNKSSLLSVNYTCIAKSNDVHIFLDICDNKNKTGNGISYIGFNVTSSSAVHSSVCSCVVKSVHNKTSISIWAADVRLAGGATLSLSAAKTKMLEGPNLIWYEDGVLLSSGGEILVELAKINQSALPHSVWLVITGQDHVLSCGNYSLQNVDMGVRDDSPFTSLWFILALVAGAATLIFILIAVICRCVCTRCSVHRRYDVVDTSLQVTSQQEQPAQNSLYASNVYFEVEPNTYVAQASGNSIKYSKGAMDNSLLENIYSHLGEAKGVAPSTDLYDTVPCNEYSTLQRQAPGTIIDNIYNQ